MHLRILITLLLVGISFLCHAQQNSRVGFLPQINFNSQFAADWKLNAKLESRQFFLDQMGNTPDGLKYRYALTDLSVVVARVIGGNGSLAGGYLLRLEEEGVRHRFIQQFALVQRYPSFRLGHRFAADQTFASYRDASYRFRYRIGLDRSLNGQEVDRFEFYLKATHEYLNAFSPEGYDLEIRFSPSLGFVFTDNNKIEAGLDYRLNRFLSGQPGHTLYFTFGWYVAIR